MKIFIYRGIAINADQLNTENIGGSWSLCSIHAGERAESMAKFHGKDSTVVIEGVIDINDIDKSQTFAQLFESLKNEFEIIPNLGAEIDCEVLDHNTTALNDLYGKSFNAVVSEVIIDETHSCPSENTDQYENQFAELLKKFDSIAD